MRTGNFLLFPPVRHGHGSVAPMGSRSRGPPGDASNMRQIDWSGSTSLSSMSGAAPHCSPVEHGHGSVAPMGSRSQSPPDMRVT